MKLKTLEINLQTDWEKNAGKYKARIEYASDTGGVEMILDEKVSEAVLVCIGETITKFASAAAQQVADNILCSVNEAKQINNPPIEASTTTSNETSTS